MSCTNTVRVDSPCHPRLLLALTKNLPPGSTTIRIVSQILSNTPKKGPTQIRDVPPVVARYDLELHPSLWSTRVRFDSIHIPQTQIINGRAVPKLRHLTCVQGPDCLPGDMFVIWKRDHT